MTDQPAPYDYGGGTLGRGDVLGRRPIKYSRGMPIEGSTIAITGAAGFIGRALAERFVARGARVRGLDMRPSRLPSVESFVGDVTRTGDAERLCRGADVVVHTAAIVGEGGDLAEYRRVNVGGTRTIANAGAKRVVHLSSVMVYGFDYPADVDEDGPRRGENNAYCQTKIESEDVVRGRPDAVVIRPGDVYGVGSVPWVVRPLEMIRKRMFAIPRGGFINHVHVQNLIDAVVLAIEKDAFGQVFNVSDGVATSCEEYFGRLAATIGRGAPMAFSPRLLRTAFGAIATVCDRIGVAPPARPDAVSFLTRPHRYSIDRAQRVLGYVPRITLDQGMAEIARTSA